MARNTNASFKMKQSTKRGMMTILNAHERGEYKRIMIDAQLTAASAAQRTKFKKTEDTEIAQAS